MQNDFLCHVWQNQHFDFSELRTVQNEMLQVIHTGHCLQMTDSEFFNAQIVIGDLRWAGSVSVCLKSSDLNRASDNTILLVVYEHDAVVYRNNGFEMPVLELKEYVSTDVVQHSSNANVKKIIKFVTDLWD